MAVYKGWHPFPTQPGRTEPSRLPPKKQFPKRRAPVPSPSRRSPSGPARHLRGHRASPAALLLTLMVEQPPYPGEEDPHPQPGQLRASPAPQRLLRGYPAALGGSGPGPAPGLSVKRRARASPGLLTLGHRQKRRRR